MAQKILGKMQMIGFQEWKGLTSDNHLGSIFQRAPQKATNTMVQLLALHYGKTLDTLLSKYPTKEFDDDTDYTWEVIGSSRKNVPLVEARYEDGTPVSEANGNAGIATTPFYLVFAEDWFADGDVIVGELNEIYPLRILGEPVKEGTNTVYKVELMGGVTTGMPYAELVAGKRFSKEYDPVEREGSRKVGDIHFAAPVAMRNEFSSIRLYHKVWGNKLNRKVAFGIPVKVDRGDGSSKSSIQVKNMWMHYVDWQFEQEFNDDKNRVLAFGRSNRNSNGEYLNYGKSGNVIKMGDGLFAQMEVANTTYYNEFSLKLIENILYDLSASKLGMNERRFVLKTGEKGAILFHKAVLDVVSGWTQYVTDNNAAIISKTQSQLHSNSLTAGFQFTEFKAPNGVIVSVDVDPYYDDPVRNKIQHPLGGPAMSYRFDIFSMGTMDQPNIFKVGVKGQTEIRGYRWGLRNPFTGEMNNPYMSYDEDSAEIHKLAPALGICVLDPTRTVSLIPAILAG